MRKKTRYPKKRIKRVPNWRAILWTFFILNVILGLFFSRVTSIRKVRVLGAAPYDHMRIVQHLQSFKRIPYFKVNRLRLETLILTSNEIENVTLKTNIFGRALLDIEPRAPVASIYGVASLYLSKNGSIFYSKSRYQDLPNIIFSEKAQFLNTTFAGPWEYRLIADFCKKIPQILPKTNWDIALDAKGMISLNNQEYTKIKIGSLDALDEKLRNLQLMIKNYPDLLTKAQEINLISPKNPVYVP